MEEMKQGLRPCPFCGGEAKLYTSIHPSWTWHAVCEKCGVRTLDYDLGTPEKAANDWNRRYEPPNAEIVHCHQCEYLYFKDFSAFCPFRVGSCKPDGFCDKGKRRDKEWSQ